MIRIITLVYLFSFILNAQDNNAKLFQTAQSNMQSGRYSEAISAFNSYIAQNPRDPKGYFFRGLSYEKTKQYDYARVDLRNAIKLDSDNQEYRAELRRLIQVYNEILDNRIEGLKRELAINPNNAFTYLEIGKAHREKEEWNIAESWYDQYLERDDNASPDEIIRFSIILTETKNYTKGERILKKWAERYPDDWRLWSRLGWFRIWLGMYKPAEEAFDKALAIKPFFQEAIEGMKIAKKEGYITQFEGDEQEKQEYIIDKYFRLLRSNPGDSETRFKLVDELVKVNRFEEAYQQLEILKPRFQGTARFDSIWQKISSERNRVIEERLTNAQKKLEANPLDKEALLTVAQSYEAQGDFDTALELLDNYFAQVEDEKDPALLYMYARLLAWFKDFDNATYVMDQLLEVTPNNIDFKLFRAQLAVWNNGDYDLARSFLEDIYPKRPKDLSVLLTYASLELNQLNVVEAQKYLDIAKSISPGNADIIKLQSNLDFRKLRLEEEQLFITLEEGRKLAQNEQYDEALPKYEEYIDKAEPNILITKEYGDILFRAGDYDKSLSVYNSLLAESNNEEARLSRGQLFFELGQNEDAINDFTKLVEDDSASFKKRIYLTDAYTKAQIFDKAERQIDTLENWDLDSAQIKQLELRRSWLPMRGVEAILAGFPLYARLGPSVRFYSDNLGFSFLNFGSALELGLTSYLTIGVMFYKSYLSSDIAERDFTTFKGAVYWTFSRYLRAGVASGNVNTTSDLYPAGDGNTNETDLFITYYRPDTLNISGTFTTSDGAVMLYAPNLINTRVTSQLFRLNAFYKHSSEWELSGYFQYIRVFEGNLDYDNIQIDPNTVLADYDYVNYGDNEGNSVELKVGKEFIEDIKFGYKYFYSNYKYDSPLFYSPIGFESHSIWSRVYLEDSEDYKLWVEGELGYVPASDFLLRGIYAEGQAKIEDNLIIYGTIGGSASSRDGTGYTSFSGSLSISWMFL